MTNKYLEPAISKSEKETIGIPVIDQNQIESPYKTTWLNTNKGNLEIRTKLSAGYTYGDLVYINEEPAPDGKYVYGWPSWTSYVVVKDGKLKDI